jgi:predicted ester cyclase
MIMFRIEDGKIVELWGVSNRMGMLTQLGILPDIG